jgi:riboflavin synthase
MQVAAPPAMVRPEMFTGIVTDVGRVRSLTPAGRGRDTRLVIETAYDTGAIAMGASIACAGCCLTVVEKGPGWFALDASGETLSKTTLGAWRAGRRVNLERPLKMGDELGGHIVSGHVDAVARLVERKPEAGSTRFVIELGDGVGRYIAPKGSVAIDGVSLTVNEVSDAGALTRFGVNIIPHTLQVTTFGDLQPGDGVNLEVDMLARYVARLKERT